MAQPTFALPLTEQQPITNGMTQDSEIGGASDHNRGMVYEWKGRQFDEDYDNS